MTFKDFFPKPKVKVRFLFTGMDLFTWRNSPEYLAFARELWTKKEWQQALSAIRNAAPSGYPIRGRTISDVEAAIELGRKEGYQDCLNVIFSLPKHPDPVPEEIEADFDPKDYNKPDVE
jgi:hypothetical protein